MRRYAVISGAAMLLCLGEALPAAAQVRGDAPVPDQQEPLPPSAVVGRAADVGNGEIGQRQTREEAGPNINPLQRIETRIATRVQSRIRNRLDADYDPQANAASPFRRAEDEARTAGRTRRR